MEVQIKKIGKLVPEGETFTAYKDCVLHSVRLVSSVDSRIIRFIAFSSSDSFELLPLERKIGVLFNSELSKADLSLILTEYRIENISEN